MHRFRHNDVSDIMTFSCKPKMTSSMYLRWGALCTILNDGIRKGENGFLLVFDSNLTSIMHCFRDNDVFLQTGNDVMVIPPLGGAARSFRWRILEGWPKVNIHALLTYFAYLQPPHSFSTFSFGWDFPTASQICGVFRENDPNESKFRKTLAQRALSYVKPRLLSYRARGNWFTGLGCTRG